MDSIISKLQYGTLIKIANKEYTVKTKTWYLTEEDKDNSYLKCELNDNRILVLIPSDNLAYLGSVIDDMKYDRVSQTEIKYNNIIFNKTGEGHQFISKIEFGNIDDIEGNCSFEDFESRNNIISLGILTDTNKRADVYADIIDITNIKI